MTAGLPSSPFTINSSSPQAVGLSHWWPGAFNYDDYVTSVSATPIGDVSLGVTDSVKAFLLPGDPTNSLDYIDCDNLADTQGLSLLTVSAWFYTGTLEGGAEANGQRYVFGNEGFNSGFMLRLHTSDDKMYWYVYSSGYKYAVTPDAILANTWYHATCVYDNTATSTEQLKLYINGVQVATGSSGGGVIADSSSAFGIGAAPFWTRTWLGSIRDVRIYSGLVLTPELIYQIWEPSTRWDLYLNKGIYAYDVLFETGGSGIGSILLDGDGIGSVAYV
jgi:hypothetical protein